MSLSCDPSTLIDETGCLSPCVPMGSHDEIHTYLLAQINGGSTDPQALMDAAVEFNAKVPAGLQDALQAHLLCQILDQGGCLSQELADAAKCYKCIPRGMQKAVQTYLMCQWTEGGQGICDHPVVLDWLDRIAADFQPRPSDETIQAVCDFCDALDTYGIMDKMLVVNPIIPDDIRSMRYPLIWQPTNGVSPFINHNFVAANLNQNGVAGDGGTTDQFFDTRFNPDTQWSDTTSGGLTVYEYENANFEPEATDLGVEESGTDNFYLSAYNNNITASEAWCWNGASGTNFAQVESPAFYSANRISNTVFDLWKNTVIVDSNNANQAGASLPNLSTFFMAINGNGGADRFSGKRVSFMAIHEGLTAAEVGDFFWAVQVLRMDLGGGFV